MVSEVDISQEISQVLADKESVNKKSGIKKNTEEKSVMAQLLDDYPVKVPLEGEKIEGRVVGMDSNALYLDLGVFGSGIVYGKDIKDGFGENRKKLKNSDKVVAVVLDLENEDGYVELSITEAVREEAWQDLNVKKENRDIIDVKILDANKGGLMIELNGITGFMPVSQLTAEHYPRVEDGDKNKILEILRTYMGTEMSVCVLDANKEDDKLIVSEKEANRDREKHAIAELKVGDIIEGEASGIVDFGAFVKFLPPSKKDSKKEEDKLEGLVHISQLDWQLIDDPRKIVKVGDKVKAKIISIDDTRISLSVRALKNDPWASVGDRYKVGDKVAGKVHKINHFGAFVYLDQDIHGLAHVSGFSEYPRKGIDEIVKMEGEYYWQIMSMEPNEHRMGLKFSGEIKKAKKNKEEDDKEKDEVNDQVVDKKEKREVGKEEDKD